jgi:hypothetical protein
MGLFRKLIHKQEDPPAWRPPAEMLYVEEIVDHFEKAYPGRESFVFHEIVSDLVHIDVNVMKATEKEPFHVLYTNGMSDLPMSLPEDFPPEERAAYERAEVMLFLPPDWELSDQACKDERNYWPIRLLKQMARLPHEYRTWLGYGHTVPNGAEYEPYAPDTGLSGVVLCQLGEETSVIHTKDGGTVTVYFLVPLYKEEMEYKLETDMDALLEKLDGIEENILILDPRRTNACGE